MKKLFKLVIASIMTVSMVACGGGNTATNTATEAPKEEATASAEATAEAVTETAAKYLAETEQVKMMLVGGAGGTFWGPIEESYKKTCEEKGWEYAYTGVTDAQDAVMLDACETALVQGYNVIASIMNDLTIFDEFVKRATDQGVLVLAMNSSNAGYEEWVPAMVGIDGYQSGRQQGEKLAEFVKERDMKELNFYVGLVAQNVDANWRTFDGVVEALKENLGDDFPLNQLGVAEAKGNAANAQDGFNALYVAHPEVNCIIVIDAYSGVGASAFVEEKGLQGKVLVCGLELSADAFRRIQNGSWTAASFVDVEWMGAEIVNVAEKILKGQPYEVNNYPGKVWVVTQEEIDAYCKEHGIEM